MSGRSKRISRVHECVLISRGSVTLLGGGGINVSFSALQVNADTSVISLEIAETQHFGIGWRQMKYSDTDGL